MGQSDGLHLGVVGVGRIGVLHAATLVELDNVAGVTLADADAGRARQIAKELGTHAVASREALIEAGVDARVIATLTAVALPLVEATARAGLPSLCVPRGMR